MRIRKTIYAAAVLSTVFVAIPSSPVTALTQTELRSRIASLRTSLRSVSARLEVAERNLDAAHVAIARHTRALASADRRRAEISAVFGARAADLYMNASADGLNILTGTENLTVFLERMAYLEQVNSEQRGLIEELRALEDRGAAESKQLATARATAARNRALLSDRQRELSTKLRELTNLQRFLDGSRRLARGSRSGGGIRGFLCPVVGPNVVSNNFGQPRPGGPHQGDDIRADTGQPVRAVLPGTITEVPRGSWWGIGIVLRDLSGTEWWYAHLSSAVVSPGQRVLQGEIIGRVGCTGRCYGPHLHFEWHPGGGAARDPYRILSSAC